MRSTLYTIAPRAANVSLRVFTMGSRFVLLLALSRFLEPRDVGLYGLFTGTVIFSWQLIGGEIYSFSNRDMLRRPPSQWSYIIQHMALGIAVLYVLMLPALGLVFRFDILPTQLAGWFFAILICEHISQEAHRLLNFMGRPISAGVVLVVRSGAWVWLIIPAMWLYPEYRGLETVFMGWLIGAGLALALGSALVYREIPLWQRWPISLGWLKRAFQIGAIFLLSAMSFRAITTADRYTVQYLVGEDLLGVYILYIGMAMSIISVLQPAVLAFLTPKLVAAHHNDNSIEYRQTIREIAWSSVGLAVVLAFVVALFAPQLFEWIGRDLYSQHLPLLWILLLVAVMYAAGLAPQSGLYAKGKDRSILIANLSSLVVFVIMIAALARAVPLFAVPLGLFGAFLWVCVFRIWLHQRT